MVSTHLIRIMFKRTVVTHVSYTIKVRVPLVNIVHVGTVVLLIQYAWETIKNTQSKYIMFITIWIRIMNPRCKIRTGATHSAVIYF